LKWELEVFTSTHVKGPVSCLKKNLHGEGR
jgi:hypothetical protein